MKQSNFFLLSILIISVFSCQISDLSTAETLKAENADKGKGILQQAYQAHGAYKWSASKSYEVLFKDEFYGFIGGIASPFKEKSAHMRLQYIPLTFDGRIVFENEDMAGEIWGFSDYKTYRRHEQNEIIFEENKDIRFWVPTYQYFIEFPARILEANIFRWAGEKELNGKMHDLVFVSWNQVEAQKEFDQYIVWVDRETRFIGKIEYTIREANHWINGYCLFQNIQSFYGIWLPTEMLVGSNLTKNYLHKMSIETLNLNAVEVETLRP